MINTINFEKHFDSSKLQKQFYDQHKNDNYEFNAQTSLPQLRELCNDANNLQTDSEAHSSQSVYSMKPWHLIFNCHGKERAPARQN
jgi:hypothetical protein